MSGNIGGHNFNVNKVNVVRSYANKYVNNSNISINKSSE